MRRGPRPLAAGLVPTLAQHPYSNRIGANMETHTITDAPANARWVIYTRTASRKHRAGGSIALAVQEAMCRRSIEALGDQASVVEVIREVGSGDELPGLQRALDLINGGGADAIMAMSLDRISRRADATLDALREFERSHAPLHVADGTAPVTRVNLNPTEWSYAGQERERDLVARRANRTRRIG